MNCVICQNGVGEVKLGEKGLASLLKVSAQRNDYSLQTLVKSQDANFVHEKCRKTYTASGNILKAQKASNKENTTPCVLRSERPKDGDFDYKTHCLICNKMIDFKHLSKHKDRHSGISHVEFVSSEKKSVLQETLLSICSQRSDEKSAEVKARIIVAGDIRAVEAVYHRHCMQSFLNQHERKSKTSSHEPAVYSQEKMFQAFCQQLPDIMQKEQFTVQGLLDQYTCVLPPGTEPYSIKHFKRKLQQHLGTDITIAEVDGRPNVVTMRRQASSILHDSYQESSADPEPDEVIKEARHVGINIKNIIKGIKVESSVYPSPADVDLDKLEEQIPEVLHQLVASIFDKPRTQSACLKQRVIITTLCHIILQASHQSFISPLLLSTGLFIHQTTRSRVALNLLSSLGASASYDQVMDFEKAAASQGNEEPNQSTAKGFSQWVADNFDHNEDTLNGHQSTHVMGVITCQAPAQNCPIQIARRKLSSSDLLIEGNFGNIVRPYRAPSKSLMSDVKFQEMQKPTISMLKFLELDTLWLLSSVYIKSTPNWQGFMSEISTGHCICTSVTYNPMIPLNPQTNEAVYSTMKFVDAQRRQRQQCCAQLTFDQPLYAKAYRIRHDNPIEFDHLQLRLGGFHQLMSFLGAGCKCMEDSGLEELWETVYACKSLPKMIDGKSYSRTLRACLLTDAALHAILLETDNLQEDRDNIANPILSESDKAHLSSIQQVLSRGEEDIPKYLTEALSAMHQRVAHLKEQMRKTTRTAKLWLMFMDFVSTVRMFIRAERTGKWQLHLKATEDMLPLFAATGHNNYAKFGRLYLQDSRNMCSCLNGPMEQGLFTIRRNSQRFWSGTWSDMTIEQCLMRAGKTQGGLINITHRDSARTKWLLSAHIVAQYTDALRVMTNTSTDDTDHHREVNPGRIRQDVDDLQTFVSFLRTHSPFKKAPEDQLRNIATEVVAIDKVNVEEAIQIGQKIQSNLTGKSIGDVVMKKSDQVNTFAIMKKSIRLADGDELRMSSTELYQRLLSMTLINGPPSTSVFSYELAAVSPALFNDDGSMRKGQKSTLANFIIDQYHKESANVTESGTVIDGCALLQQLQWPKIGCIQDICQTYIDSVLLKSSQLHPTCVVFDSYNVATTKEPEQKRRKLMKACAPDTIISDATPVPQDKSAFLANKKNKQALIDLLGKKLQEEDITVQHAGEEGDADVLVVKEALKIAESSEKVVVMADDTDILVLLIHHAKPDTNIFMKTKRHLISINQCKKGLGEEMCQCLPFVHAMSGCDTTSAMFGIGKVKHFKLLLRSRVLREAVSIFGDPSASRENISKIGEKFVAAVYSNVDNVYKLDDLRYLFAVSTKFISVERMPPTSRACAFHSLRVHHQVTTWMCLGTVLDKFQYGFQAVNNTIIPIITDQSAAPANLLKEIRCSCSAATQLCSNCSCYKKRIPCSIHCKCRGRCQNPSPVAAEQ